MKLRYMMKRFKATTRGGNGLEVEMSSRQPEVGASILSQSVLEQETEPQVASGGLS